MNPALSISSLPSRILASKTIAILGLALALFGLSLPGVGSPVIGIGMELDVIAAFVIGGASLMGGRGTALNTVIGGWFSELLAIS
jgi:ribose transport system permease protein